MDTTTPVAGLDSLPFDQDFTREMPADPDSSNHPRPVLGASFTRVTPTRVSDPRMLVWSPEVADLLGIPAAAMDSADAAAVFSGNRIPTGADPHATVYGGHQFGNWAGQLGDGRAISYGTMRDRDGRLQELQLKGSGPTPYSRGADGRAVLRSSIREFLCSEALHHLGIPTTRALSLVDTGDVVVRDMFYDGNPRPEPGAIVCRVAPTFLRFGHFQLPAARQDLDLLRRLVGFTISRHYPDLRSDQIVEFFARVADRTMALVVDWMRVGFVHGVLNTDNMSIIGLTIDYGPYGWLEPFDPNWTPNTTDATGRRYRFAAQPGIAVWNLTQLANALVGLTGAAEPYQEILDDIRTGYGDRFVGMMARRLGWTAPTASDHQIVDRLFDLLASVEIDYLIFCRALADVPIAAEATRDERLAPLEPAWYDLADLTEERRAEFGDWLEAWAARTRNGGVADPAAQIRRLTPKYVLRNYLAQEAIDAAEQGDLGLVGDLLDVLRDPYGEQPGRERFAARRPEWARSKAGCSMLSCSS